MELLLASTSGTTRVVEVLVEFVSWVVCAEDDDERCCGRALVEEEDVDGDVCVLLNKPRAVSGCAVEPEPVGSGGHDRTRRA